MGFNPDSRIGGVGELSKEERVRVWAVEQAVAWDPGDSHSLIKVAEELTNFVLNGTIPTD